MKLTLTLSSSDDKVCRTEEYILINKEDMEEFKSRSDKILKNKYPSLKVKWIIEE